MIPKPLDQIANVELKDVLTYIQEEGQGRILVLASAPTSGTPLLQDNESGIYGTDLYIRKEGVIYKISPDATITIS